MPAAGYDACRARAGEAGIAIIDVETGR